MITETQILKALSVIQDPALEQSITDSQRVKNLKIHSGKVSCLIELSIPTQDAGAGIARRAEELILRVDGVETAHVTMGLNVTSKAGAQARQLIPGVKNAVAVASGKGGVGKSTVAANLATALSEFGAQVGLMDADVYGPSIPMLMGATQKPELTAEQRIIPPQKRGVKLISMGYFLPRDQAVIWRGPMLHKMVQDFLGLVDWGQLDYLVIDLPPGTGDIQLSLCQTLPLTGAAIVSTPQDLALEVASKAIAMFKKLNTPILGLIENMSHYHCSHCGKRDDIFGHGGARQAAKKLGYPFLGEIPLSSWIRERSDQGEPVALDPTSPYGQAFCELAQEVSIRVSRANQLDQPIVSIEN